MAEQADYTRLLRGPLDTISPEDEDFIDELLAVGRLFRPFDEAMDAFLARQGYQGDPADAQAKTAFIRGAFERRGMAPPREIMEWFSRGQHISRDTAFQLCFAFGLDGLETDDFFQRVYARERSFDCHRVEEAVYYFCLNNGIGWEEAQQLRAQVPPPPDRTDGEKIFTGAIMADLNRLETPEELVSYLRENISRFAENNVTATGMIRRLWAEAAGPEGLLIQEDRRFLSSRDDAATGERLPLRAGPEGLRSYEAYLAILQLNRREVARLRTDRSLQPILRGLHEAVRDAFPDRQGIDRILRGEKVAYERLRKWLILLTFYAFWARKALKEGGYGAGELDSARCAAFMNQYLTEAGYPELYVGNPYDWLFFYCARDQEPLVTFRAIWNDLLGQALT